jgi:hypothetical protein
MGRQRGRQFDLEKRMRREFVFEPPIGHGVAAVALTELSNSLPRDFLVAEFADAGTSGESENVFGLDFGKLGFAVLLPMQWRGQADAPEQIRKQLRLRISEDRHVGSLPRPMSSYGIGMSFTYFGTW